MFTVKFFKEKDIFEVSPLSLTLPAQGLSDNLLHVEQTASVNVEYTPELLEFLQNENISVLIFDDNNLKFTGLLQTGVSWEDYGAPTPVHNIQLQIADNTHKLDKKAEKSKALKDATLEQIFSEIAIETGIEISENIPIAVVSFFHIKEGEKYLDVVNSLCFEHGYFFYFDEFGVFNLKKIDLSETSFLYNSENLFTGVKITRQRVKADKVVLQYGTPIKKENEQLYFEGNDLSEDNKIIPIIVRPQQYYPYEADPNVEEQEGVVKQNFAKGYAESYKNYAGEQKFRRNAEAQLIYSENHIVVEDWAGKLVIDRTNFEPFSSEVRLYNEGQEDAELRQLAIRGTAYYKSLAYIELGSGNQDFRYESKFIYDGTSAEALASVISQFYIGNNYKIDFKTKNYTAPGTAVKINTEAGFVANCYVLSASYDAQNEIWVMQAISFGSVKFETKKWKEKLQTPGMQSQIITTIEQSQKKIIPNDIKNLEIVAQEDGILFYIETENEPYFSELIVEIDKRNENGFQQISLNNNKYYFDRTLDGYPEADELQKWIVRAKILNIYGNTSKNYYTGAINCDRYGTWIVTTPQINARVIDRTITLELSQKKRGSNKRTYGNINYEILVRRPDVDVDFYQPAENSNPYESELSYRTDISEPILRKEVYIQTMPLIGQTEKNSKDTLYEFKIRAANEATKSDYIIATAIALPTSLDDFVNANATIKEAIVKDLSALSANLGEVSGSLYGDELNYWTLAEIVNGKHKRGAFRVGDENQGILVIPPFDTAEGIVNDTPNVRMVLKAGVFELSSTDSKINGELFIQKDKNSLYRARISPNGIFFEWRASVNDAWQEVTHQDISGTKTPSVQSDHSMIITNANMAQRRLNGSDIGVPIPVGASVYHFDTDKFDQHQKDTLTILESETGVQPVLKGAGDAEEQAGITDFTPALLAISPYSTVAKALFGNYAIEKTIDTSNNWTVEFWLKFAWNESQTIFNFTTNNQTLSLKVLNDEPYYNNPLPTEPSYNYETTEPQKLVYNEIKRNSTELQHTTLSGTNKYSLLDYEIVFTPNEWYHFAIVSTDNLFVAIINDKLIQLKKQQILEPIQLTMNPSKGLFVLDELLISPVEAVSVDELIENYTRRIPYGSLDYKEKHFVLDINDSKVWTNFLTPTGTILSGLYTKAPSGFLFCDGSEVAIIDYPQLYATIGALAICQSENEGYFKLPDLTGRFLEGSPSIGEYKEAGLPNITGTFTQYTWDDSQVSGAFYEEVLNETGCGNSSSDRKWSKNILDASRSSKVYGNSDTVQPAALTVRYIIKY